MSPRPEAVSLHDALARAGDLGGRRLLGVEAEVDLGDLLERTSLNGARDGLVGRSVLIATRDQLASALAMIELDGGARRILLCPPGLDPAHLPALIERAGVEATVTDHDGANVPGAEALALCRCSPALAASPPFTGVRRPTEWVLLTSGTTGIPKMVAHDLKGLTAAIGPGRPARPPVWATFYDIRRYGGLQIFFRGVLGTGSLVLSSAGEPTADFLRRLGRHGVTHLSGTPSHWRRALMSPMLGAIAPDYVRLSGEIADQAVLDALRAAFPQAGIGHAYASTEAGVAFEVDDGLEGFPVDFVGRSGAAVELKVEDGSLRIRSARTASGYVGSPELSLFDADRFVDTGDMVEERCGRYRFVGRRGGIINVGGLKVHPEEIEAVINRHAAVRMSLVEGRRSPITGAVVAASVVLHDGAEGPERDAVRDAILASCRAVLPAHKVPAVLRFVPALAVNAAGKISRAQA